MSDEPQEVILDQVDALVLYTRSAQAILDLMPIITLGIEQIGRLTKRDPELIPELATAREHFLEASEAIERAFDFAQTRCSVKLGEDP